MQIKPVLSALQKHRLAALLIVLEIALACAVLCNAGFLIASRLSAMQLVSGVDESSLGFIQLEGFDPKVANDLNARVVAGLGAMPGVQSVHVINSVPFGPQAGAFGVTLDQAGKQFRGVPELYLGDPGTPEALGLKLVAGRMPGAQDYQSVVEGYLPASSNVLITRTFAQRLWPGEDALGKTFWTGKNQFRVIGVVANLSVQQYDEEGERGAQWTVFVPTKSGPPLAGTYLIRADPQALDRVMVEARTVLARIAPDAVFDHQQSDTLPVLRERFFATDRAMAGLLVGVIVALLGVTALGIVGLTSFWVAQRRKQIGIRRAIGATRGDILRYFQTENFLIVSFGIVLGVVAAIAINLLLMKVFEVPRLPLHYLPIGALALWLLGQLAVLGPALRAAAVPPVVATRNV
ncbi:MAG: FtsX-like permease family protein [Rhodanobacter sp.]|nr:MAG: FtsX-like permease family protein [Rhodanobacter sp.]TAM13513.1 MAG: FtsX-like permease family protein [Rhodanobacter sp.]TAM35734.1 MAG: FtsX-like permease family protein [Rhodanobacter sp.]